MTASVTAQTRFGVYSHHSLSLICFNTTEK